MARSGFTARKHSGQGLPSPANLGNHGTDSESAKSHQEPRGTSKQWPQPLQRELDKFSKLPFPPETAAVFNLALLQRITMVAFEDKSHFINPRINGPHFAVLPLSPHGQSLQRRLLPPTLPQ